MSGISSASGSVDTAPNNSGEIYGSIGQFSADSQQTRWSCKTCNATEAEGKRRCQNCRLLSDSDYESIIKPTGGAESPRARWSCETCQGPAADGKLPCQNCRLVSGSVDTVSDDSVSNYGSILQPVGGDSQLYSGSWSDDSWETMQVVPYNEKS